MNNDDKIELRSEKIRNIVGKIPPALLRKGIAIITLIIIILIIAAYFIPYPEKLSFPVELQSTPQCEVIKAPETGFIIIEKQTDTVCRQQTIAFIRTNNNSTINIESLSNGRLLNNCHNESFVNKGETLFVIIPSTIENIYGLSYIPYGKIYKIQLDQKVKIALLDYPSNKYGFILGQISKIYPILENESDYKVEISLPKGLNTSNAVEINYTTFLKGEAVVLLSDESFLKRFLHSIMRK